MDEILVEACKKLIVIGGRVCNFQQLRTQQMAYKAVFSM